MADGILSQAAPKSVAALSDEDKVANRLREGQVLADLFAFADDVAGEPVEVSFPRKTGIFHFRIHALTEAESYAANKLATTYKTQKALGGIRLPESTDQTKFRSHLIILATVDEDRKAIWENPLIREHVGAIDKADVVDRLLRAGEKDRVVDRINELSGFGAPAEAAKAEVLDDLGD